MLNALKLLLLLSLVFLFFITFSCKNGSNDPFAHVREKGEQFSGGATTVFDTSANAFGNAAPNLTDNRDLLFVTGNAFFNRNWVTAPSSTSDLDGLGPLFNARSCSGCHFKDGRGAPPLNTEEQPVALLFRLSRPGDSIGETIPDENYGDQFNHLSILGVDPEGEISVTYEEVPGTYPDGSSFSIRRPVYSFNDLQYGPFPPDIMISPRIAQQMIGLGLLESVSDKTILEFADPDDANGDGISGKVNRVLDVESQQIVIGRFGWKSNQPTVRQQVAGAFRGDIGITSSIFPEQPCASNQQDCSAAKHGGEPELTDDILDRVSLYSSALAVPGRRKWDEEDVLRGKTSFIQIGCSSCHIPSMTTGQNPDFPEFSNQTIYPYTDLLLHDMGDELSDNTPDGLAAGNEWRTPPLWGIGLIPTVNGHTFLLHDGRARNIEEAILWHNGEAEAARLQFMSLTQQERKDLITFIKSL